MKPFELLYGRNAVREALRARRRRIYQVFVAAGAQQKETLAEIVALAEAGGVSVKRIEREQMDKMAGLAHHQGVMAEAASYPYADLGELTDALAGSEAPALVLVLDYIQDPQNLGTLLRTAEALAVHGVVIPERRAAGVTPAVVNSSVGATEHLRVVLAKNLVRAMKDLQAAGLWMIGVEQVAGAPLHVQTDFTGRVGLVVGSEGPGMSRLVRETCDQFVQLPMFGQIDSLNAATAGSVVLYEIWRQRWNKAPKI